MIDVKSFSENVVETISKEAVEATPQILLSILFIILSLLVIRYIMNIIDAYLNTLFDEKRDAAIVRLVLKLVLWFSSVLIILSVLGYQQLATAIGTSSGFIALGVSYALKDAIRESVAGFYLMKDEDFIVGNYVSVTGVSGEIVGLSLQRTKIRDEETGNISTISNEKIEPKWTYLHKKSESEESK